MRPLGTSPAAESTSHWTRQTGYPGMLLSIRHEHQPKTQRRAPWVKPRRLALFVGSQQERVLQHLRILAAAGFAAAVATGLAPALAPAIALDISGAAPTV